jgi:radical SAM enzyme (TIGR01210 family)
MYPAGTAARDRFVLDRRGTRPTRDPWHYDRLVVEEEPDEGGRAASVAAVFLVGRECPWRCVMCDLWRQTIPSDTPAGAIPAQIAAARQALAARGASIASVKLYNAGSFFDPRAVPDGDYDAIAGRLSGLDRVIVESHPALVGPRTTRFMDALARAAPAGGTPPRLEVAVGLETVHRDALARLNKRMTVEDFARAASRLRSSGTALRVFVLIGPPFVPAAEQDDWLVRSVETAVAEGATAVSLIPVRPGNGAIEALAREGAFIPPGLEDIERSVHAVRAGVRLTGRLLVDLWDLERFAGCRQCFADRRARLHAMNLSQQDQPAVPCYRCGGSLTA